MNLPKLAAFAALSFTATGGVYFGLFSCGGYTWHWQAFLAGSAFLYSALLLFPGKAPLRWRLWPAALAAPIFVLAQAFSAPLYPDMPGSVGEYSLRLADTFRNGVCD